MIWRNEQLLSATSYKIESERTEGRDQLEGKVGGRKPKEKGKKRKRKKRKKNEKRNRRSGFAFVGRKDQSSFENLLGYICFCYIMPYPWLSKENNSNL